MHGTTGEWIDYTGSDEQICDMLTSDVKFTVDSWHEFIRRIV